MQAAEASKIVSFMAKVKIDNEPMKAWIGSALNALMGSSDPVSVRFCQTLNEAINHSAVAVLNESVAGLPPAIPGSRVPAAQAPAQGPTATPAAICESILDHASKLMI